MLLTTAAAKEAPKVTWYEAITRGSVTVPQKAEADRSAVRTKTVERGSSTIRLR